MRNSRNCYEPDYACCRCRCDCCCRGPKGADGKSAYEIAVKKGFVGTEEQWLESLKGACGKSAYEIALEEGFVGTEEQWLESLKGEKGEPGEAGRFLAGYVEAVGGSQTRESGEDIVFDTNEDYLDIVGTDITIDEDGTVFTIRRPGLYRIEWSVSLNSAIQPIIIGLMENNQPTSAISSKSPDSPCSSGALINVTENDLPFTVSLRNFGGRMTLSDPTGFENVSASIRISKFADGPTA